MVAVIQKNRPSYLLSVLFCNKLMEASKAHLVVIVENAIVHRVVDIMAIPLATALTRLLAH